MVEINRVWLNVDTDTHKITLCRPLLCTEVVSGAFWQIKNCLMKQAVSRAMNVADL